MKPTYCYIVHGLCGQYETSHWIVHVFRHEHVAIAFKEALEKAVDKHWEKISEARQQWNDAFYANDAATEEISERIEKLEASFKADRKAEWSERPEYCIEKARYE